MAPPADKSTLARTQRIRSLRKAMLIVIAAALVPSLGLISLPDHHVGSAGAANRHHSAPAQLTVRIPSLTSSTPVPRSFLGLSTEYWTLPYYQRHVSVVQRVLSGLHAPGSGPLILRIGGDSADHARWDPGKRGVPAWVFRLTPGWLERASSLVRRARLHVILDLNVDTASPAGAARLVAQAERRLPQGSIVGLEIGNEPDVFDRSFQIAAHGRQPVPRVLPRPITAGSYVRDFEDFAQALSRVAPGMPLIGPALASPRRAVKWSAQLLSQAHPGLQAVSAHSYPFSACARRRSSAYPTIWRLLNVPPEWARTIGAAATLAHVSGLHFRLTELNSVDCGGLRGVSNTFATALWAPDALFQLLRTGVDGVDLHVRAYPINAPFAFFRNKLVARPLLYGMILFARTLGPDARLVPVKLQGQHPAALKVWAVNVRGNVVHLLVIEKSHRSATVRIALPGVGGATVQRLLAPSVSSTRGETLAGQHLSASGRWVGHWGVQHLGRRAGEYRLRVPGMSAALLSVHVRAGTGYPPAHVNDSTWGPTPWTQQPSALT